MARIRVDKIFSSVVYSRFFGQKVDATLEYHNTAEGLAPPEWTLS